MTRLPKENQRAPFGPPPFRTLIVQYALLALYGVTSALVGVTTVDAVAGSLWGVLWPLLVTALACLALAGVVRSWASAHQGFELVTTLLLMAILFGYTVAILLRTLEDGEVSRLPVAWLPVILAVYPATRLVQIARSGRK